MLSGLARKHRLPSRVAESSSRKPMSQSRSAFEAGSFDSSLPARPFDPSAHSQSGSTLLRTFLSVFGSVKLRLLFRIFQLFHRISRDNPGH